MPEPAIEAIDLVKRFGRASSDRPAVDGVSFTVVPGTVLGMLGPNGAGKPTTVRMMTTLTQPTSGTARVAGYDVRREPDMVRRSMGLTGQVATVDELLTGRENIRMIGGLYGISRRHLKRLESELLERFSIADAADRPVRSYSGGMRRRLDLAVSLIASPPVLFLDEPTTGLDPRSRSDLWDMLRGLVAQGTTLLLTTQYLEEADQLADNIVVIDRGRIIAEGTPLQLKQQAGNASLVVTVSCAADLPAAREILARTGADVHVDVGARQLTAPADGIADLTRVAGPGCRPARSTSTTSACRGPASTTCSSRSPATAPRTTRRWAHDRHHAEAAGDLGQTADPADQHRAAILDHGQAQHDPH